MRKEFDLQCRSPDLTISGDEKLLCVECVCLCVYVYVCESVVDQHVIQGFWGLIKELKKVMQGFLFKVLIPDLQRGQTDVSLL